MSCKRLSMLLAACCTPLVFVPAAEGQTNPLDPDSPAGVEYQLPLEQARKNLAGRGGDEPPRGSGAASRRPVPLFGAGIVAARKRGEAKDAIVLDGQSQPDVASLRSGAGRKDKSAKKAAAKGPKISRSSLGGGESDDGSATWRVAGVALGVLLAGALLGFGLRRGLGHSGK